MIYKTVPQLELERRMPRDRPLIGQECQPRSLKRPGPSNWGSFLYCYCIWRSGIQCTLDVFQVEIQMLWMDRLDFGAPFLLFTTFRRSVGDIPSSLAAEQLRIPCALFRRVISSFRVWYRLGNIRPSAQHLCFHLCISFRLIVFGKSLLSKDRWLV